MIDEEKLRLETYALYQEHGVKFGWRTLHRSLA